jgi:hypothetical protein
MAIIATTLTDTMTNVVRKGSGSVSWGDENGDGLCVGMEVGVGVGGRSGDEESI